MSRKNSATLKAAFVIALIAIFATACGKGLVDPGDTGIPAALTSLPRPLTATETQLRDAANDFSFALLGTINATQANSNVFISPLSASFALGMTMNGAANTTFSEMRTALQLRNMSQEEINGGYKSLLELLVALDPAVQLRLANSIWYRNSFPFKQTFFDSTAKYFFANVQALNFNDRAGSLSTINSWANIATNSRIPTVLDDIDDSAVMFLINAIYFKGSWRDRFDASETATSTFVTASGASQPARLMHRTGDISYAETAAYQAADLSYGNSAFSMMVVLPKAGNDVNAVAKSFNTAAFQTLSSTMGHSTVNFSMPKIKLSYERQLKGDLNTLGMRVPFTDSADFSKMTPQAVSISFVKQNSFVDINEEGTEAAAVTTVGVHTTAAPVTIAMRVDRPYLFIIRERLSGTILFMGKIASVPQ